ncbi:MAG TPA: hypothetical protein VKA15_26850 [Isosphaeraceae bacterium]|nr:hypothetical protein [Isosphaeraceae bacterium]
MFGRKVCLRDPGVPVEQDPRRAIGHEAEHDELVIGRNDVPIGVAALVGLAARGRRGVERPELLELVGPVIRRRGDLVEDVREPRRRRLDPLFILDLLAADVGEQRVIRVVLAPAFDVVVLAGRVVKVRPDGDRREGELLGLA